MRLKIQGGTVEHGEVSLCKTCRHGQVMRGDRLETITHCDMMDRRIFMDVKECSKYDDSRLPSLYDMRQQAWVLRTDEKKRTIGFVPYKSLSQKEKTEVTIPDLDD